MLTFYISMVTVKHTVKFLKKDQRMVLTYQHGAKNILSNRLLVITSLAFNFLSITLKTH